MNEDLETLNSGKKFVTDHRVLPSRFAVNRRSVSACRVLQVQGGRHAGGVLPVLQVPDNTADEVACEHLRKF